MNERGKSIFENEVILLKQVPVISHQLKAIGENITLRMAELNIPNLLATEDTIQTLKQTRAELNKEANVWESQRKSLKEAIMSPYNEFDAIYKTEIIDKYKEADAVLKSKIADFEMKAKTDKKENLLAYFEELKFAEKLDFLSFEMLKIEVNLSTSEKKYKEQILEAVTKIVDDLNLIESETHASEMLVEYQKTLNVGEAIRTVRARKEAIKQAEDRRKMEIFSSRRQQLLSLSFVFHDITRTFNWVSDESVMVQLAQVENSNDQEWVRILTEIGETVNSKKPQPVSAPIVVEQRKEEPKPEETFLAKFEVTGTYAQLKALGDYMKSNNLPYKNI